MVKITKKNLKTIEYSYYEIQYTSAILLTLMGYILFWNIDKANFNTLNLFFFQIGFTSIFIIFCINIWILYTVSNHIELIYNIMGKPIKGTTDKKNNKIQIKKAYNFQKKYRDIMLYLRKIFRWSLIALLFSVCLVLLSKHNIINNWMVFVFIFSSLYTLYAFIYITPPKGVI